MGLLALLFGCAPTTTSDLATSDETPGITSEGSAPERATAAAPLPSAPQVAISVNAGSLPTDRLQAFQEHGGAQSLVKAVADEITKIGKQFGTKPTQIQIAVTGFRLRSSAAGFWLGALAGADILDVRVIVVTGGQTKKTFDTGVGGVMAGFIKPTAKGRFEGLLEVLSERIVEEL